MSACAFRSSVFRDTYTCIDDVQMCYLKLLSERQRTIVVFHNRKAIGQADMYRYFYQISFKVKSFSYNPPGHQTFAFAMKFQ